MSVLIVRDFANAKAETKQMRPYTRSLLCAVAALRTHTAANAEGGRVHSHPNDCEEGGRNEHKSHGDCGEGCSDERCELIPVPTQKVGDTRLDKALRLSVLLVRDVAKPQAETK